MYTDLYFRLLAGNTTPAAGHLFQEVSSLHYFVVRLYSFIQVMKYVLSQCGIFEDPTGNKIVHHTLSLLTITATGAPTAV